MANQKPNLMMILENKRCSRLKLSEILNYEENPADVFPIAIKNEKMRMYINPLSACTAVDGYG
jgi:hypothetical protein